MRTFLQQKNICSESGVAMMIAVIFFVVIATLIVLGLTGPSAREYRIANDSILSKQSYFLAESGVEDTYYRLKNSISVNSSETLVLGGASTVTTMTPLGSGNVDISSIGNVYSRERSVDVKISGQTRKIFNFVAQAGAGGLEVENAGASLAGDVYSNGPITAVSESSMYGVISSAGTGSSTVNQSNETGSMSDISFGNTYASYDIAQSFQLSGSDPLDKISLYIKKVGTPSSATVAIYRSASSTIPEWTSPIATSTLVASTVSTSYGWVDVNFPVKQNLSLGTTYWIVVTMPSFSTSNYYTIGTSVGRYSSGMGITGHFADTNWHDPISANSDYFFRIYLTSGIGSIEGSSGTVDVNSAQAHTIKSINAMSGFLYCNDDEGGNEISSETGYCTPHDEPSSLSYPISDTDISRWEQLASSTNVSVGDVNYTSGSSHPISSEKIIGNLHVSSGTLYIAGTLWVTGDIVVDGLGKLMLDSSYGSRSGVVIADGKIIINGTSSSVKGTGISGSKIILISKSTSLDSSVSAPAAAIFFSGVGANTAIFYAPYGLVLVENSSGDQVTGYKIRLLSGGHWSYDSALSSLDVYDGTTSSGGYGITSWEETQ